MVLAGNCGVVLTFVFIPLCYNAAQRKVKEHSKFEPKMKRIEGLNYFIAAASSAFFIVVMSRDIYELAFR